MYFKFEQFELEIDVEKTKNFYKKMGNVSQGCSCQGCRNYEKAINFLPGSIPDFFNNIGVDMRKITEVFVNCVNEDKSLCYGGFYHICGKLLNGKGAWEAGTQSDNASISYWNKRNTYEITKNFYVSFGEEVALLEKDFPMPILQIDIEADIPWVLDEECSFL